MVKSLLQSSALLAIINLVAGLFHYSYQIIAARSLDLAQLGELNFELSLFSFCFALGTVTQYSMVLSPPRHQTKLRLFKISIGFLLGFGALGFGLSHLFQIGARETLWFCLPWLLMTHLWLGVFQSQNKFWAFGLGGFSLGFLKLFFGYYSNSLSGFLFAVSASYWLGLALQLGVVWFVVLKYEKDTIAKVNQRWSWRDLLLSFTVGLGFVLFPIFDLFNVKFFMGDIASGQFTRIQLFSKILYFAPLALLQVALPQHVKAFQGKSTQEERRAVMRLELGGLLFCYLGCGFFWLTGPWIAENILKINGINASQIGLACLAITPLYGLLSALQIFSAAKRLTYAIVPVLLLFVSPLSYSFLGTKSLDGYLLFSAILNTIFGMVGFMLAQVFISKQRQVGVAG